MLDDIEKEFNSDKTEVQIDNEIVLRYKTLDAAVNARILD